MSDLLDRARKVIAVQLDIREEQVVPLTRLVEDLDVSVEDIVELAMALEEEFEFLRPRSFNEIDQFKKIQDVFDYVTANVPNDITT